MFTKLAKLLQSNLYSDNRKMPFVALQSSNGLACYIEGKDYSGSTHYMTPSVYEGAYNYISNAVGGNDAGFLVGSGDTPATENDYCLESKINGLTGSISNFTTAFDTELNCYYQSFTLTLTNPGSSDVVIKELGRIVSCYTTNTKGSSTVSARQAYLLERIVLDNPVTIEAGGSGVIMYRMNCDPIEEPEP